MLEVQSEQSHCRQVEEHHEAQVVNMLLAERAAEEDDEAQVVNMLLAERAAARLVKDFATADRIQSKLKCMGYTVQRGPAAQGIPGSSRKVCSRDAVAPGPEISTLPALLREERMHEYPFVALISELLNLDGRPLDQVHLLNDVQEWRQNMESNNARAYAVRRNIIDTRLKTCGGFHCNAALKYCYLHFLREVVLPLIGDQEGIFYQVDPCFRCHLPGTGYDLVSKHCDADYFHSPNEVNFWVPCTPCFDSNTLFVESAPKRGDFHPWTLGPGQMMQFWGNQCVHYTLPNETDRTRVSFDFRIIPRSLYLESYPMSHRSDGLPRFAPGAYFAAMDP